MAGRVAGVLTLRSASRQIRPDKWHCRKYRDDAALLLLWFLSGRRGSCRGAFLLSVRGLDYFDDVVFREELLSRSENAKKISSLLALSLVVIILCSRGRDTVVELSRISWKVRAEKVPVSAKIYVLESICRNVIFQNISCSGIDLSLFFSHGFD